MTVLEVPTNGDAREAAFARYAADGGSWTIAQVAEATGLGARQAGTVSRDWKRRLAANGGSPASEVPLPSRPAPRAISAPLSKTGGKRAGQDSASLRRAIDIAPVTTPAPKPLTGTKARVAELEAEVAELRQVDRGWLDWLVIAVVGTAVAVSSFGHIVELGLKAGLGWYAYLAPIALDGLTVVAIRARQQDRHKWGARFGIAAGIAGSVAANVFDARPELINLADARAVLVAYPPVALAVIVHLVRR